MEMVISSLLEKPIVISLLSTLVGSLITLVSTYALSNREHNKKIKKSATLLYFDIKESLESIRLTTEIMNKGELKHNVLKMPHTRLINNYGELITDIKDKLTINDINKFLAYYHNLTQLEDTRTEYWNIKGDLVKLNITYQYYQFLLNHINEQNIKEITRLIDKVKKLSGLHQ